MFEKHVYQGILLVGEHQSKIILFLGFHARRDPTIRVRMFITLEEFYVSSEVYVRMFITLEIPSEASEGESCPNKMKHSYGSGAWNFLSNGYPAKASGRGHCIHNNNV